MPELQVIARHTMRRGTEDQALGLVADLIAASRTEPGNLGFAAYRSFDDPQSYVLLERYASRAAFAAHRESEHFKDIVLGRLAPILESRTVEAFDVEEEDH